MYATTGFYPQGYLLASGVCVACCGLTPEIHPRKPRICQPTAAVRKPRLCAVLACKVSNQLQAYLPKIGLAARAEAGELAGCCPRPLSSMGSPAFQAARASASAPGPTCAFCSLTSAVLAPCMQATKLAPAPPGVVCLTLAQHYVWWLQSPTRGKAQQTPADRGFCKWPLCMHKM